MIRKSLWAIFLASLICSIAAGNPPDQIYYRDGAIESGRILDEHKGVYTFQSGQGGRTAPVPKEKIRFVLYGNGSASKDRLGLEALRRDFPESQLQSVRFLSAEAFGEGVLRAVRSAKKTIYMTTYSLSGAQSGRIGEIFDALGERASAGVKVYIISSAGAGTHAGVRIRALNSAEKLAATGVRVRFITSSKVQHKKLVIVDSATVFLGSSNLTLSGVSKNIEINVSVTAPEFASRAVADFRSLLRRAKAPDKISF